jgi:Rrf2 family protein
MAMFGAKEEYALHTVLRLALIDGVQAAPSARDLAEFEQLPVAFVRKLLTRLGAAGIVAGSEGPAGGWRLAQPPEAVRVLAVVDAVSDAGALFDCRNVRARCALWPADAPPEAALRGVCSIHAVMLRAEQAMRAELAATTLADLVAQVRGKTSAAHAGATLQWFAARGPQRRGGATKAAGEVAQ